MTEEDIDRLMATEGSGPELVIRQRSKLRSITHNARCVLALIEDAIAQSDSESQSAPQFGYFDAFIWNFVQGQPQLNEWEDANSIPTHTETSIDMANALKKAGFRFVGPKICYSLMQSCGLVVDHPIGTPEWESARETLQRAQRRHKS